MKSPAKAGLFICYVFTPTSGGFRLLVDHAFGNLRQSGVGFLFFGEGLIKQLDGIAQSKFIGPCLQCAVTRNLIVFYRLCRREQTCIEGGRTLVLFHNFRALVGYANNGIARLALWLLVDGSEDLLEAVHMAFGLGLMLGESPFELRGLCRLFHLGKRAEDLLLREVDVFQRVVE